MCDRHLCLVIGRNSAINQIEFSRGSIGITCLEIMRWEICGSRRSGDAYV
ncbi:hypothetical protein HanPSC8_Chr15g0684621 [Helianthus annuus]|nr:hypothetical protein HanPSC8_Chr15g0684621 [Helianthus annuus]